VGFPCQTGQLAGKSSQTLEPSRREAVPSPVKPVSFKAALALAPGRGLQGATLAGSRLCNETSGAGGSRNEEQMRGNAARQDVVMGVAAGQNPPVLLGQQCLKETALDHNGQLRTYEECAPKNPVSRNAGISFSISTGENQRPVKGSAQIEPKCPDAHFPLCAYSRGGLDGAAEYWPPSGKRLQR